MLPKVNRLDPKTAKTLKQKVSSKFFSLYYLKKESSPSRFMVVVGSRVYASAAKRNALKRQIRGALMSIQGQKIDGVLVALPGVKGLNNEEVRSEIREILNKI